MVPGDITGKRIKLEYVRKRIDHWCSVEKGKSQSPQVHRSSGKRGSQLGKPRFPLEQVGGPSGWDFPISTEHQ